VPEQSALRDWLEGLLNCRPKPRTTVVHGSTLPVASLQALADLWGVARCGKQSDLAERILQREGVRSYALDPKNAEALWKKSEEMVGESF
jgi:hypothetical protein